ncbi:hypothetical protein K1719_007100 [Acacia pycnantha]|nr:hypothetical protein K1719_007100 [Acacia pycnantha]
MSAALLPPSLSSIFSSSSSASNPYPLHCVSPPFSLAASRPAHSFLLSATASYSDPSDLSLLSPTSDLTVQALDQKLLTLLRQRKTEDAWIAYTNSPHLPSPTCLSRLVSQLSFQNTRSALTRAQSIVTRLRHERQLHRLDANCLGLLAVAATKAGYTSYATSIVKSMLRSGYLPHVKAWSAVVSGLASSGDDGPVEALRLFKAVTRRVRKFNDLQIVSNSRPDTVAFNAALNACANLGDSEKFLQVFDEMPQYGVEPDALTYNVMIKLCCKTDRKDLLVFVLERILEVGIPPCMTTLHSLVSAYVGLGDLKTAEKLVQAMREQRTDLCKILREPNSEDLVENDESVFKKLLPNLTKQSDNEPPLLPKVYAPNSRLYTTLMKGYMQAGRVSDTVKMLEAMRRQDDRSSHPDHVSYTTVVSALVKLQIDQARELLKEMVDDAGIQPDVVSYNILIDGCILVDDSAGALAFFNEMRAKGIAPTKISYTTLMKAFALSGQPKLAQRVFDEMLNDPRVKADRIAWNMLVEGYCRLGLIEEAKKIIEKMEENGLYPDVATYGSLANGIALARRPGEALLLWNEVKERCRVVKEGGKSDSSIAPPLKPDEGLLDTLADICVRAAFFKKALEIVACMEEHGIPPNKTKFTRIYVEMHSRMFTSKHASQARQDRRIERKRAAEAFKFWLGLPNSYYGSEWRLEPIDGYDSDSL